MSNKHLHQLGLVVALGSLVINVCSLAYHAKHLCSVTSITLKRPAA